MKRRIGVPTSLALALVLALGCAPVQPRSPSERVRDERARREACETIQTTVAQGMQPAHGVGCDLLQEEAGY